MGTLTAPPGILKEVSLGANEGWSDHNFGDRFGPGAAAEAAAGAAPTTGPGSGPWAGNAPMPALGEFADGGGSVSSKASDGTEGKEPVPTPIKRIDTYSTNTWRPMLRHL